MTAFHASGDARVLKGYIKSALPPQLKEKVHTRPIRCFYRALDVGEVYRIYLLSIFFLRWLGRRIS